MPLFSAVLSRQMPLALGSDPLWRFDNYVPAPSLSWDVLRAVLQAPQPGVPVYLWGGAGSGKSHLLHACATAAQDEGLRVSAFSPQAPLPWEVEETTRLLVFDDCDQLDAHRQHAAFAAFIEAATLGVPIVAAGALPPVDLPLRDDLRSRLGSGLVFQLAPPSEDDVRQILQREAQRRGLALPDEVVDYLLRRHARDLHTLMDLLDQLDHYALSAQRALTVPLVREWMQRHAEVAA